MLLGMSGRLPEPISIPDAPAALGDDQIVVRDVEANPQVNVAYSSMKASPSVT